MKCGKHQGTTNLPERLSDTFPNGSKGEASEKKLRKMTMGKLNEIQEALDGLMKLGEVTPNMNETFSKVRS